MSEAPKATFGLSAPPASEDVLFGPNFDDPYLNACINHWWYVDDAYKNGFRTAALQLAEKQCKNPQLQDHLIYPIVFLYRHHIEMVLKSILRLSNEILQIPQETDRKHPLKHHNLGNLWVLIRPNIPKLSEIGNERGVPEEELIAVDSYMRQLDEHDPDGMRFRYAYTKKDERSLPLNVVHINIRSFAINMEKLADYLSGIEGWLRWLEEAPRELNPLR